MVAATNTAQVFLAKDTFSAGDFGYGLIFGCIGLGLAIGSFGAGTWVERRSVGSVYAWSVVLQAIGLGDPLTTNICFGGTDLRTAYITVTGAPAVGSNGMAQAGLETVLRALKLRSARVGGCAV